MGAPITEEESELLQELIYPHEHHHAAEETLFEEEPYANDSEEEFDRDWRKKLPWYKRPSPVW